MRRLSAVALSAVLVAASSTVALAESGPKVSGRVFQRYQLNLTTGGAFEPTDLRLQLNVEGQASQGTSYYARLQVRQTSGIPDATGVTPEPYLANVSFRLPMGATLTVGRQTLNWTILDELKGMADVSAAVARGDDAILLTFPVGRATVTAGYDFRFRAGAPQDEAASETPNTVVAFARIPFRVGGPQVTLGAQLLAPQTGNTRWGVNGSLSLGVVTPYLEFGSGRVDNPAADYQVLGVRFDVLKQIAGLDALLEYDFARTSGNLFARVSRQVLPGLTLHLRRHTNGHLVLRAEASVSF